MPKAFVLSIVGPDRPGLVEHLSSVIAAHNGNWTESRMARLASQFAGVLLLSCGEADYDELCRSLRALESEGLHLMINDTEQNTDSPDGRLVKLELTGQDRPGIVHDIAHFLASLDISIEELETHCYSAAWTGEVVFQALATLRAPASLATESLLTMLDRIADDLAVDIQVHEARSA